MDIIKVEGIGDVYGPELREINIATTEALLEKGATPKGREEIDDHSNSQRVKLVQFCLGIN